MLTNAGFGGNHRGEAVLRQWGVGGLALLENGGGHARRIGGGQARALRGPLVHQEDVDVVVDERRDRD